MPVKKKLQPLAGNDKEVRNLGLEFDRLDQTRSAPLQQEVWVSQPAGPLLRRVHELFHTAGYTELTQLDPDALSSLLFSPSAERTELIEEMMRKIHSSNQFWLEDTTSLPNSEPEMNSLESKFFTIAKWYGLTSKVYVIQGSGSELEQVNFWANLIKTSHLISQPVVQPKEFSEADTSTLDRIINSSAIEKVLKKYPLSVSGDPEPDASECVEAFKNVTDCLRRSREKVDKAMVALTEKGVTPMSGIKMTLDENAAVGKTLKLNMKRVHQGLVTKSSANTTANPIKSDANEIAEWASSAEISSGMLEIAGAVKHLRSKLESTKS